MRIYDGSPRQDWEDVLRAIGAFADRERLKEILLLELEGGFVLQGLALPEAGQWSEATQLAARTYELTDEQVAQLLDEATAHRGEATEPHPHVEIANYYENALRVLGGWIDAQRPRDVFFFEQEGAFVLRLLMSGQAGSRHELAEFTREDIADMVARGPSLRHTDTTTAAPKT